MEYLLIAVICFLASYVGASMGTKGEVKDLNPVAPIAKKIAEKKQQAERIKQSKDAENWLWHNPESESNE